MNELKKAQIKLNRIENEQAQTQKEITSENNKIPFGQPNIIGRGDIYKTVKRQYAKAVKLSEEQEKQENRIAMLEKVEEMKDDNPLLKDIQVVGKTEYASIGAKTSVNNLEYFKNKLKELELQNKEAKAYNKTKPKIKMKTLGSDITKLKRKIEMLEEMQEKDKNKKVSEKSKKLIESGKVNQWTKKPIYFFVKGLKKVALELDENGEFIVSKRYPAYTEEENQFIKELLF
ncbi:hypothetical protein P7D73_21960 [Enterococcus raffinosus]|uniref:hypothetical protein n=1 Tax=Enterococcus raffinosus TaxID=71452 RepID=UPI00288C66AE|nr:hypothetical protein [Enterococcus raffinosus]MDT2525975.1 hypothetical protein [Enterococcus raffinosus]MDT2593210.1 hypothetical protein [Enterococcus raffinosus]